ncbi:hypothetical protein SCNU_13323 [Gordonia neofelifaecis NRRL B-59395]|uniref:DUF3566 domain-containing protein n=2 Tax=Gordonia TaxID=2053 RepID=F1YLA5_9ACTN|nr:hypothetical protein SCNU_13323 [Gordonia neofelifaecis NRRL B-59395]
MTPPWKRGENTAATGLTAGDLAKAAGNVDDDRAGGPPPRGVVSGGSARPEQDAPGSSGPMPVVNAQQDRPQPGGGLSGPAPKPPQQPVTPPAAGSTAPASKPSVPAAPAAPAKPEPFVESATRNIPREALASKDELPDLDSIHQTEQAKEQALARASSQTIPARSVGTPLRAAVQIRRVDPWSVFKVSGVLSVAGFFIWMIAVAILYGIMGGMGIWDQINSSFGTLVSSDGSTSGQDLISGGQVFMFSALFGIVAAILLTALSTISAYIYNVCADMVGGVEVTLADLD